MRYRALFCCCDATLASCYLSILGRGACRLHDGRTAPFVGGHPEIPAASAASGGCELTMPTRSGPELAAGAALARSLKPIGLDKCVYMRLSLHCASLGEHPKRARDLARRYLRLLGCHGRRHLAVRDGRHARQAAVVAYRMGRGPEVAPGQRGGRDATIPCVSTSVRWPSRGVA